MQVFIILAIIGTETDLEGLMDGRKVELLY